MAWGNKKFSLNFTAAQLLSEQVPNIMLKTNSETAAFLQKRNRYIHSSS